MSRVLVIGLDAATFDLVVPWVEAGRLPLFAKLLREGASGTLQSTVPAMSPPAWTSIITGLNPGRHGIFDFVRRQPGTYNLQSVRRDFTRFRTIFDWLSAYGKRVAAVNIPMTYPPAEVNGIMISGLGAPAGSGRFTHPVSLRDELMALGYRLMESESEYIPGQDVTYTDDLIRVTREHGRLAADLLRREPWDLFFVVFRGVDEAQSYLWHHSDPTHPAHDPEFVEKNGDPVLRVYQATEEVMNDLIQAAGDDVSVVVVSDHGGGPLYREVYLNAWLSRQGWLTLRHSPSLTRVHHRIMRRFGVTRDRLSGRFAGPMALRLRKVIPLSLQHRLLPANTATLADAVEWSRTRAYSFGYIGQIYVNLKGREPAGIVEPGADYERLIEDIVGRLDQLVDPLDGRKVVDRVYRRSEVYHGPYAELGADLNVIMRNMSYITHLRREMASSEVFGPIMTNESGTHRPNGMLILCGPSVLRGQRIGGARVTDITPTLLNIMGVPVPDDLDGRTLSEALSTQQVPSVAAAAEAVGISAKEGTLSEWDSASDEAEVLERLRRLGYLE